MKSEEEIQESIKKKKEKEKSEYNEYLRLRNHFENKPCMWSYQIGKFFTQRTNEFIQDVNFNGNQEEWNETLIETVISCSNNLYKKHLRSPPIIEIGLKSRLFEVMDLLKFVSKLSDRFYIVKSQNVKENELKIRFMDKDIQQIITVVDLPNALYT